MDRALLTHAQITGLLKAAILAADPAKEAFVRSERLCAFGQWIYGQDGLRHCGRPEYQALRTAHRQIHDAAFVAFCHCRAGRRALACESIERGAFHHASDMMKTRLLELRDALQSRATRTRNLR